MPLSIKAKQVAGVTAFVTLVVVLLSGWFLATIVRVRIEESDNRAQIIARAIYQRAREVVHQGDDPIGPLQDDGGLKNILQAAYYSHDVTYAAIVDVNGQIIVSGDPAQIGNVLPERESLDALTTQGPLAQVRAIAATGSQLVRECRIELILDPTPLSPSPAPFGAIRVGVSTLVIRSQFESSLRAPLLTAIGAIIGASVVAWLLAQIGLRPIHVIQSGLARLGRGELDVAVDLPSEGEFGALGASFKAVTARLAADRTQLAGEHATLASVIEHLEDAVALVGPDGALLFANPAMRTVLGAAVGSMADLPLGHPYRAIITDTLQDRQPHGPVSLAVPGAGDRLVLTNVMEASDHRPLGVLLIARNIAYLSQVESTLRYSRKLAALGRLSAGIAHEIKNPLNAVMIHLELLRQQVAALPQSLEHVSVIAAQMRRLDDVVQGFLKFTRPEDLRLQPVRVIDLFDAILPVVRAEADRPGIDVRVDCPADLPLVSADPTLFEQALLNLALNACQAMPNGGRLRLSAAVKSGRRVEISVEDSGVGIPPDHLSRIFDLYFTTKEHGSGIGLSMVYRTIQLHDGDIEVQSVPGAGTTFRVTLRQADSTV